MKRVSKGRVSLPTTLAAFLAVAITFTFNGCSSDDDDGGSFMSCKEADKIVNRCYDEIENSAEYKACGSNDTCQDNLRYGTPFQKCITESGACGNTSLKECGEHYENECEGW
jgi:hypothetical protein